MKALFDRVSVKCSTITTKSYSTSFSLGIKFLDRKFHAPIYSIYGFVRFADEIVDTFHGYEQRELLEEFRNETYKALDRGISINPILNSFQQVVNDYKIEREHIDVFLDSMEMDLDKKEYYNPDELKKYVLGSAEVVGLMCLHVFTEGNKQQYDELKYAAMQLGSAFQKINFLRDLEADYMELGRSYFPEADVDNFNLDTKRQIEQQIEDEFSEGLEGIRNLPQGSQFGVYVAYVYYYALFEKIRNTPPSRILEERIRIPNFKKILLLARSYFHFQLKHI
ncbi:MAG: phytoene/squalene synthase family protein [Bacteroidota bacterium]